MTSPQAMSDDENALHQGRRRRAVAKAFIAGLLLHTLAVGWVWTTWEEGLRGGVLVWMDLPASLFYLGSTSISFLFASLVFGGLEWGLWGALLSALMARLFTIRSAQAARSGTATWKRD